MWKSSHTPFYRKYSSVSKEPSQHYLIVVGTAQKRCRGPGLDKDLWECRNKNRSWWVTFTVDRNDDFRSKHNETTFNHMPMLDLHLPPICNTHSNFIALFSQFHKMYSVPQNRMWLFLYFLTADTLRTLKYNRIVCYISYVEFWEKSEIVLYRV